MGRQKDPLKSLKMMQGREGVVMKFKDQNGNDIIYGRYDKTPRSACKEANKKNNNLLK